MRKLLILAVAICGFGISMHAQTTSCQTIGSFMNCSNGLSATQIGNFTFYNNGTTANQIGNFTFYNSGTTANEIGDFTFYSGTVRGMDNQIGDFGFYNLQTDDTSFTGMSDTIGSTTFYDYTIEPLSPPEE